MIAFNVLDFFLKKVLLTKAEVKKRKACKTEWSSELNTGTQETVKVDVGNFFSHYWGHENWQ